VNVKLFGQLVERQPLVLSLVMSDHFAGTPQHRSGDRASPAIQWPIGLKRSR
jgi:hypothetical protein